MIIKVLFLKRDGVYEPDINTDVTIIFGWNDSAFHLLNGRARVYIGPYKSSRFNKNNIFIL